MKKTEILIFLFICFAINVFAQNKGLNVYTELYSQPNPKVKVQLIHRAVESKMIGGQPFACKIKNLTNNKIEVSFNLMATTTCGNDVVGDYLVYEITPNGMLNLCNEFTAGYDNVVTAKNCSGELGSYSSKEGKVYNGINRIKSVSILNLEVKDLVEEKHAPAGTQAVKANATELSDDEKLNQALMKKMENDFDESKKTKKVENLVIKNQESITNTKTKTNSKASTTAATKQNKANPDVEKKIAEYKSFIVSKLNNYSHKSHRTGNGSSWVEENITISNCYWIGNEFHYSTAYRSKNSSFPPVAEDRNQKITRGGMTLYDNDNLHLSNDNGIKYYSWIEGLPNFRSDSGAFAKEIADAFNYIYLNSN